ncbi:MAG: hypothetical protein K0Q72_997, partial [Armatimonadetes bacterium]|nr:hypothetical protein [Armatimonadota bacterium]
MTATLTPPTTGGHLQSVVGKGTRPPEITIPAMFRRTVEHHGEKTASLHKVDGKWIPTTYRELALRVQHLAAGLLEL